MGWPFGGKPRERWRDKPLAITSAIPLDDDRAGPVPPPPRTAHAPGLTIHGFAEVPSQHLLRWSDGISGFFLEGDEGGVPSSAALLVLSQDAPFAPGDVLIWVATAPVASPLRAAPPFSSPLEETRRPLPPPHHHIKRDDLSGRGVPGITGLRTRHAGGGLTVLRLGPPPGARWVFLGLRALAVFAGKVTLVDGEDARVVGAGSLALVADPTATLYLEAGNDSALGVALGGGAVVSALS